MGRKFSYHFLLMFLVLGLGSTLFAQDENCLKELSAQQKLTKDIQAIIDPVKKERKAICDGLSSCEEFLGRGSNSMKGCLDWKDYAQKEYIKENGNCRLTYEEFMTIVFYSGFHYKCINKYLREKPEKFKGIDYPIEVMNRVLDKLPSYEGYVLRGADLNDDLRKKHEKGNIVTYDAFTSTSTKVGFKATDQFIIFSRTGKPIMSMSVRREENEVLFKSGSKFKVIETYKKNESNYYVMKEIIPGESKELEEKEEKRILDDLKNKRNRISTNEFDYYICNEIQSHSQEQPIKQKNIPSID